MATLSAGNSAAAFPFCRPEEDPFLLLEYFGKAIESILRGHAGGRCGAPGLIGPKGKRRSPGWRKKCCRRSSSAWRGLMRSIAPWKQKPS
jgi:hypothetical protein